MTYSIVARDKKTGEIGVAVQSHFFSVGSIVPWARAGVGAVATQSLAEVSYGPLGLELMGAGKSAEEALYSLISSDKNKEIRQVAMIDSKGRVAVHTGKKCIPYAGHVVGDGFSCQGNIMRSERVWEEMARAFEENDELPLPERLIASLEAGEEAGGDIRGKQSASIIVVSKDNFPNPWQGKLIELRVEDNPDPIIELKRLLRYARAYAFMSKGDELLASERLEDAMSAYLEAMRLAPEVDEIRYWVGMSLQAKEEGRKEGLKMLKELFRKDGRWIDVTKGIIKVGLLPVNISDMEELLG